MRQCDCIWLSGCWGCHTHAALDAVVLKLFGVLEAFAGRGLR